ncbi:unnamed protein product, partial [Rotaria sp. Silwood2]
DEYGFKLNKTTTTTIIKYFKCTLNGYVARIHENLDD